MQDGIQSKKELQSYNFGNGTSINSNQHINSGSLTLPVNQVKSNKAPPPPPVRGATATGVQPPRPATMNRLKQSDSSFGLHSPDNLPLGFNPGDDEVQVNTNSFVQIHTYFIIIDKIILGLNYLLISTLFFLL